MSRKEWLSIARAMGRVEGNVKALTAEVRELRADVAVVKEEVDALQIGDATEAGGEAQKAATRRAVASGIVAIAGCVAIGNGIVVIVIHFIGG